MRLKRNCIFFNANIDGSATVDWGHELGQSSSNGYLMKIDGCSEIINGLVFNKVKDSTLFSYGRGNVDNKDVEIISIFNKVQIKIYNSDEDTHIEYTINNPFIVIIAKEIIGSHIGRRTLKMNIGFSYDQINNKDFYDEINKKISDPWFAYSLNYDNINTGILKLTIIKAPKPTPIAGKPNIVYNTLNERNEIWDKLERNYIEKYDKSNQLNTLMSPYHSIDKKGSNVIYFGSPGTGKSNTIDKITGNSNVRKITFHPEYDYQSFVGSYKPSMDGKDIIYKFVPQIFTNIYIDAWKKPEEHFYLQIEEINRGNCAEIFGDLFQLLDRDLDGSSKYKIDANEDLAIYLKEKLGDDHEGIKLGKIKLPHNLSFIATMNTSDQSLFPMDSAFKRRWDWEYIKINYECDKSNFIIKLNNGNEYEWLKFLKSVNIFIFEITGSPDKQIGNWFINATDTNKIILEKTFINKVLFYLWNDIFKDEDESLFNIVGYNHLTYEDFFTDKNQKSELIVKIFEEKLGLEVKENNNTANLDDW